MATNWHRYAVLYICVMAYRAAVVGGSGYTGAELLRLLAGHPEIEVVHVTADSNAGAAVGDLYPSLAAAYEGLDATRRCDAGRPRRARPRVPRACRTAQSQAIAADLRRHRRPRRRPRRRLPAAGRRRTSSGTARRTPRPSCSTGSRTACPSCTATSSPPPRTSPRPAATRPPRRSRWRRCSRPGSSSRPASSSTRCPACRARAAG